jgi:general stress protein 26
MGVRMWNDQLEAYFSGPDTPNFCVVVVTPPCLEYMGLVRTATPAWEA